MDFFKNWLGRMNYKYGRRAITNLMNIIVFGMALVFLSDIVLVSQGVNPLSAVLAFDRSALFAGQVWRLVSFIIIPVNSSILFIILSLYFYWLMGTALESEWGSFKFNIFYLFGVIGTILAGLITGYAVNTFLNMSLFLAFALLYPDFQMRLFFLIPVKVKYLAYIEAAYLLFMLIFSSWQMKIVIFVSLLNIVLFFWTDFTGGIRRILHKIKWRKNIRNIRWK